MVLTTIALVKSTSDPYALCDGKVYWIGDKWCDDINNNPECNYDGGDCCDPNARKQAPYCIECQCKDPQINNQGKCAGTGMNWIDYHPYKTIDEFVSCLADAFPEKAKLINIGQSWERRNLKLLRITNDLTKNKSAVWIDGGIHAREWISPSAVTYMMNEFLENSQNYKDILDNYDLYILPLANPDGYEFSGQTGQVTGTKMDKRFWRKNRNPYYPWDYTKPNNPWRWCPGVDLNRNWETPDWGIGIGQSSDPCDFLEYQGSKPFSEPETKSIKDFIMARKSDFKVL